MNRSTHSAIVGSIKRIGVFSDKFCSQTVFPLLYGHGVIAYFSDRRPKISSYTVFLSVQKNYPNDSVKMKSQQRNIRNGKHKRASAETALRPDIPFGKWITTVSLDISDSVTETILLTVNRDLPIDLMFHAENAVPALHKGNISERPHDVVAYGRKIIEFQCSAGGKLIGFDIQFNAFIWKQAVPKLNRRRLFNIFRKIERYVVRFIIGDNLQRRSFLMIAYMKRRNKCDSFFCGTAFEVSSFEIIFDFDRLLWTWLYIYYSLFWKRYTAMKWRPVKSAEFFLLIFVLDFRKALWYPCWMKGVRSCQRTELSHSDTAWKTAK